MTSVELVMMIFRMNEILQNYTLTLNILIRREWQRVNVRAFDEMCSLCAVIVQWNAVGEYIASHRLVWWCQPIMPLNIQETIDAEAREKVEKIDKIPKILLNWFWLCVVVVQPHFPHYTGDSRVHHFHRTLCDIISNALWLSQLQITQTYVYA